MNGECKKILEYTGNPSQVFYAQRMKLAEGRADGEDVIEVFNGKLLMWIMAGRCMDIGRLFFNGQNMAFLSKGGFSNAFNYDSAGTAGLETFAPGFLTTCGLRNSGVPNTCGRESFGIHGRIGQTPAEEVCVDRDLLSDEPAIILKGRTREGKLFGSSLELCREIRIGYGRSEFTITDTVTNFGALEEPLFLLYHFNMGYPLLDENSVFVTTHKYEKPVDKNAETDEENRCVFKTPRPGVPECCYYYRQNEEEGRSFAACVNKERGIGVAIHTRPEELPLLCEWKNQAAGDYVMGIEPCNCYGDGRAEHIKRNQAEIIPAYGQKTIHINIKFLGKENISEYVKK